MQAMICHSLSNQDRSTFVNSRSSAWANLFGIIFDGGDHDLLRRLQQAKNHANSGTAES